MPSKYLNSIAFVLLSLPLFSQENTPGRLYVKYTDETINNDGKLDEAALATAERTDELWQFSPTDSMRALRQTLSDLFLVYNDNYFVSHFEPRFRSINLKMSYWLNI